MRTDWCTAAGCSKYATGVPGSLDHLLPEYGVLLFSIGALASWPASNNAAIFADVSFLISPLPRCQFQPTAMLHVLQSP